MFKPLSQRDAFSSKDVNPEIRLVILNSTNRADPAQIIFLRSFPFVFCVAKIHFSKYYKANSLCYLLHKNARRDQNRICKTGQLVPSDWWTSSWANVSDRSRTADCYLLEPLLLGVFLTRKGL